MADQFEVDFEDVTDTTNTGAGEPSDKGDAGNQQQPAAAIDPNALAEALATALVRAQQANQPPPEPERDPSEVELERLRARLVEIDQKISELTISNPEHPQIGQLILEKESIRSRIGDIESTLPLKRQMTEIEQRMQLMARVPFQIDKLVAMAEKDLAKFGERAPELKARLRAELADAAQRDPAALFNEEAMARIIRAWIGEQVFSLGLIQAPYDPATGGASPGSSKDESDIEAEKWRRAIAAIGLNPDKVIGGENA